MKRIFSFAAIALAAGLLAPASVSQAGPNITGSPRDWLMSVCLLAPELDNGNFPLLMPNAREHDVCPGTKIHGGVFISTYNSGADAAHDLENLMSSSFGRVAAYTSAAAGDGTIWVFATIMGGYVNGLLPLQQYGFQIHTLNS